MDITAYQLVKALHATWRVLVRSPSEVSHRLNYVPNTVSAIEMARKSPTLRTLEALAGVYSVKVSTIILAAKKCNALMGIEGKKIKALNTVKPGFLFNHVGTTI